jgi:hypothetical protein
MEPGTARRVTARTARSPRSSARGWLERDGRATPAGRAGRAAIEEETDVLAVAPFAALGAEACERLAALLRPVVTGSARGAALPYPNPMGVPAADA